MEGFYSGTGGPYAYADTSSDAIKAWAAKYKERTKQDANSAAQYGYVSGDIVVRALEAAGKDSTRAKFLAALEVDQELPALLPRPDAELQPEAASRFGCDVPGQGRRRPLESGC